MKKLIYTIPLFLLVLSSCEKEIDLDLPEPELMLVVDGNIESNEFARVTVSKSVPYFEEINFTDPNTLQDLFVTNATVVLSDGILTDTLEFTIDPGYFPPVYYKGTDPLLKGVPGKKYYLTIYANGDTLTSTTTIPQIIALDSIYWQPDGNQDSLGFGWGRLDDPDTTGNIYQLFSKRQGYVYYGSSGTLDDRIFNGQSTAFSFVRPQPAPSYLQSPGQEGDPEERFYFKRGDTITVKFCTIDNESYNFIRTYEQAASSFGNPFASPTFVQSNVNGGFGGFVGYGVSYHTYIVPQ